MPYEQSAEYWQPTKDIDYSAVNCMNNFYDYSTITDTPDSVLLEPKYESYHEDENYFKFDADTIEKLMPPSDSILQLDTEYVNYNDDNCNSKNNSPCSSPWIGQHQQSFTHHHEFKYSNASASATLTSGSEEPTQILQLNNSAALPSINQIFSQNFSNYASASSQDEYISFPSVVGEDGFFDVGMVNIANPYENSNSELELSKHQQHSPINLDNYNFPSSFDDKPNREYKNIWCEIDDEKVINSFEHHHDAAEVVRKSDEIANVDDEKLCEQSPPDNGGYPLICCWEKCNLSFESQIEFVAHIEKNHVCMRKGDEYTCLWTECPRKFMPFNARYKLLIHMRGMFELDYLPFCCMPTTQTPFS